MFKRILALSVFVGLGLWAVLATPGPDHKIDWCHFPPGNPANVQILSIDVAADGCPQGKQHLNHEGDGPVETNACQAGLGPNCGACVAPTCPAGQHSSEACVCVCDTTNLPPDPLTGCAQG